MVELLDRSSLEYMKYPRPLQNGLTATFVVKYLVLSRCDTPTLTTKRHSQKPTFPIRQKSRKGRKQKAAKSLTRIRLPAISHAPPVPLLLPDSPPRVPQATSPGAAQKDEMLGKAPDLQCALVLSASARHCTAGGVSGNTRELTPDGRIIADERAAEDGE